MPPTIASAAEGCMPAGGVDGDPSISQVQTREAGPDWDREVAHARLDPFSPDAHDVVFSGGGWGHGVGMSQYGAQGAARAECTATQILQTYYPGTSIEGLPSRDELRLKLWTTDPSGVTSVWMDEQTQWVRCDADGRNCREVEDLPADTTVHVSLAGDDYRIYGDGIDLRVADHRNTLLQVRHRGDLVRVQQGTGDAAASGRAIRYGELEFDVVTNSAGTMMFATTAVINQDSGSGLTPMETYLLGLAEVPWSWEMEALKAQVVAARSYAESRARDRGRESAQYRIDVLGCDCHLVVTTGDQVWAGADKELAEPSYYPRWREAVDSTAGSYVVRDGRVFTTFYSSSHGGVSRAGFMSNGEGAGYASVDASRWEKSSGNSRYRWSEGFSRAELQAAFGIDDIDAIDVVATDDAGYPMPGGVVVRGVDGGQAVEKELTPDAVRSALGLLSPRFVVHDITDLADDTEIPVARVAGETRIGTAIRLSEAGWSDGADTVVLAREDEPADALTGSALAGAHGAPLLLTPRDHLAEAVAIELQRLEATRVLLLGGEVALSAQVEQDLRELGIPTVERVEGATRHGTAVDVATRVARGDQTTAYLVRLRDTQVAARGWVDALSVAAVAARRATDEQGWPILGTEATLPDETRRAIVDLGITRVVPVGGPDTIPQEVLDRLAEMDVEVADRLAGQDRYGTSRAVTATDTPTAQTLVIATGQNFPDGLAAGPFTARTGAALLLVPTTYTAAQSPWGGGQHPAFISALGWKEPQLVAVGGPVAIQNPVIGRVSDILEAARP